MPNGAREGSLTAHPRSRSAAGPALLVGNGGADWSAREPRGFYPRIGKPLLEGVILAIGLPFAALLAVPVALANALAFRSLRCVLFRQVRIGHCGQPFVLYKFRTMREGANTAFDSWAEGGDAARVTRFGRFLRNSHLDELPQLFNVLRGDMALIGPRPEMVEIESWAAGVVPRFTERLAVHPGITGWAQVQQGYTGRDTVAYERKLALGLEYLEGLSLRRDLTIIGMTVRDMLGRRGWRWREDAAVARIEAH